MAFSFRLEDLSIKLLLDFSEKQRSTCSLAENQPQKPENQDFSSGCGQLLLLF